MRKKLSFSVFFPLSYACGYRNFPFSCCNSVPIFIAFLFIALNICNSPRIKIGGEVLENLTTSLPGYWYESRFTFLIPDKKLLKIDIARSGTDAILYWPHRVA